MHPEQPATFHDKLDAATSARERGDFEAAAGFYAEAIPLDPSPGLIALYGHMLKEAGHLRSAVAAYKAAIRWDGTAGDAYVHLGHLLKRLGRIQEAINVFTTAETIPYGPHVRPEINGLIVAQLNAKQASRPAEQPDLKPLPEPLRRQDDKLKSWLNAEDFARTELTPMIRASRQPIRLGERQSGLVAEPMADLVIEDGLYRATTANPRMRLRAGERTDLSDLAGQWLEISLTIVSDEASIDPILLVEEKIGWAKFSATRLVATAGDRYSAVTRLPESFLSLRLDPVHSQGRFQIAHLDVTILSDTTVAARLMKEPDRPAIGTLLQSPWREGLGETVRQHFSATMADDYTRWIALNERKADQADAHPAGSARLGFIMPVGPDEAERAAVSLRSLRGQTSGLWSLAVLLDERLPSAARTQLENEAASDPRVRFLTLPSGTQQAGVLTSSLNAIETALVALLPAGDQLAPSAVAQILVAAEAQASLKILVCDHDEIDSQGRRHSPRFKPDWNLDYLLCFNYVGPAVVFSRKAVIDAGGWRDRFEGLETYDLLLRVAKGAEEREIAHLSRPVWQSASGAAASSLVATVNDFLVAEGKGRRAEEGHLPGTTKLIWPMPAPPPHVTLIIPTRDRIDLLKTAIDTIVSRTTYPQYDIIVVDNGSVEAETFAYFAEVERGGRVSILRDDGPFNFSRLNNRAAAIAKGEVLALVNNDVEVEDGAWLSEMVPIALDPSVGAVGAKLLYGSGHVQHAGIVGGVGTVAGHGHKFEAADAPGYMNRLAVQQAAMAVTAACLVVESKKYKAVGGLDEDHLTVAFNDVDLCLKLNERGWRTHFTPWAVLKHHESISRGLDLTGERAARFRAEAEYMVLKWGSTIERDGFYSDNLTREFEDFSLRWTS